MAQTAMRAPKLTPSAEVKRTATGRFSFVLRRSAGHELKDLLEATVELERTEPIWCDAGMIEALHAAVAAEVWHKLHGLVFVPPRLGFSLTPSQAVAFCSLLQTNLEYLRELRGTLQQKLT